MRKSTENIIIPTWIFWLFISLLVILSFFVLIPYFVNFHGGLSENSQDWSNFGSYVGGLLGPVFSLFSIILVIISIQISLKSLKRNENQQKIERLYTLVFKVNEELDNYVAKLPAQIPKKKKPSKSMPADEFKTLQVRNILHLQYKWLSKIVELDSYDSLTIHITERDGALVRKLDKLGWFALHDGKEMVDFYNRQSAKLFRDNL